MSSTSNSQNLLTNVFRPTYAYDPDKGFIPKLVVSNVDSVVGTKATFSVLNVGDDLSNVYIGSNAGNPPTLATSCNSTGVTALGLSSGSNNSNCDNSVFMGNFAGSNTSNVDNSVYMGALAGNYNSNCANSVYIGYNSASGLCNASNEIAIGANTIAGGSSNIYVGTSTGSSGRGNIFIGPNIAPGNVSNQLRIGTGSNIVLYADTSAVSVGINTVNVTDVSFAVAASTTLLTGKLGVGVRPTNALDVSGKIFATEGILMGLGTAATPAISLADYPGTGIFGYSNTSYGRTLGLAINGQERMTVTDTSGLSVFGDLYIEGAFKAASTDLGSNFILNGYMRAPDFRGTLLDVSAAGIYTASNISVGGGGLTRLGPGFITDTCTNGYIRLLDDSFVIKTDISAGNISNSGTTRSSNFITATASSNVIGGVTLNNNNISYSGTITGSTANTSNRIGGVTLSNGNLTVTNGIASAPSIRFSSDTSTGLFLNSVGGLDVATAGVKSATFTSNSLSLSNTTRLVTADIASNFIGGVVLSNYNVSNVINFNYSGTITGSTANTSNRIGGVVLSNNDISYSGTITGSTANTSNSIGGIVLSNGIVRTGNGSVSAPAVAPIASSKDGLWFPSSGIVAFSTIGAETLRAGFTPTSITNCSLWLDGADTSTLTLSGTQVTQWRDKSSGGLNATNLVGTVTYSASGLVFNGSANMLSDLTIGTTTPITVFIVATTNLSSGFATPLGINAYNGTRPNMLMPYQSGTTPSYWWFSGGAAGVDGTTVTATVTPGTMYVLADYWSPNSTQVNVNGTSYASSTQAPGSLSSGAKLLIGSTTSGGTTYTEYWNGTISEVIIFTRTLTSAERNQIEGYLAWKWSTQTSLPSVHAYSSNRPLAIGIGTTAPLYPLDVSGTINASNILTSTTSSSNSIGGVTLGNNNISYSGTITGSTANTSNRIGGVTLSNAAVRVGDGTATLPSISFTSDPSSGIHYAGSSTIAFDTSGVQRMCISGTNVGIGTTAPNRALHVVGTARMDASMTVGVVDANLVRMTSNDSIYAMSNIHTDSGSFVGVSESQYVGAGVSWPLVTTNTNAGMYILRDTTSATSLFFKTRVGSTDVEQVRIASDGKVGVGTTAPVSALDICGTGTIQATIRSSTAQAGIRLAGNGVTDASGLSLVHNTTEQGLSNSNTQPFHIWTNNNRRFSILSNGNVGIANTSPLYRLDIAGPGTTDVRIMSGGITPGAGGQLNFGIVNGASVTNPMAAIKGLLVNFPTIGGTSQEQGHLGFYTRASNDSISQALTERVRITSEGNMGIGLSNAQQRLALQDTCGGFFFTSPSGSLAYNRIKSFGLNSNTNRDLMFDTNGDVNPTLYLTAGGRAGIGLSNPAYKLDVSTDISANASINMNTWTRTTNQNTHIIRGLASIAGGPGGIITWSTTATSTIDPNLMTPSATNFIIRKSGIWSVTAIIGTTTGGFAWMDVSTTTATPIDIWTAGNPVLAFAQSGGTIVSLNYTGYLPSNSSNRYSIRTNTNTTNQISNNYIMFTFLGETVAPVGTIFPGGFPY